MWPSEVPSDTDVEDRNNDQLAQRWSLFIDLHSEFQGAAGAYGLVALGIPAVTGFALWWGWAPEYPLLSAVLITIGFGAALGVSLYSWIWVRWLKRRIDLIDTLLDRPNTTLVDFDD